MLQLLKNARLYAPEPRGDCHLLIAFDRIVWIGTEQPVINPRLLAETIDLAGRIVAPGLVDGHVHITGGGGEAGYASRVPPVPLTRFGAAGVTTVVGLLGTDDTVRTTASLVAQARALCEQGLTAYCYTGGYHLPPTTLTGSVRTDIVAIDRIIGVGELALSDHRSSQPTLAELLRIAADAHVAGLMTGKAGLVHLHLGDGERGLDLVRQALHRSELPPRVFNPTHINRRTALFDEALPLAKAGCHVDITAYPAATDDPGLGAGEALIAYLDGGGPAARVTISSDGGGCLPQFDGEGRIRQWAVGDPAVLLDTLRTLVAGGMNLAEALAPFTTNQASLLRLPERGRLAAGQHADLIVLEPDLALWGTMANGRWLVQAGRSMARGHFESGAE